MCRELRPHRNKRAQLHSRFRDCGMNQCPDLQIRVAFKEKGLLQCALFLFGTSYFADKIFLTESEA